MISTKRNAASPKTTPLQRNKHRIAKVAKVKGRRSKARATPIHAALVGKNPKVSVSAVRKQLGLSQGEFARVTGYSLRSIAGWETGKPLSDSARQKLVETERLRAALGEILPAKELREWMRASNPAFEGQTPIQVIERGEMDRIWRMIYQIDAGVAN
jgi:DNA-binding transcriptional regulator YiaG